MSDIDPQDIDPDTGRPYAGYSSPALDTSFHDHEMDVDEGEDDSYPRSCTDQRGHKWVCRDDDEEISYCVRCGADGNV